MINLRELFENRTNFSFFLKGKNCPIYLFFMYYSLLGRDGENNNYTLFAKRFRIVPKRNEAILLVRNDVNPKYVSQI